MKIQYIVLPMFCISICRCFCLIYSKIIDKYVYVCILLISYFKYTYKKTKSVEMKQFSLSIILKPIFTVFLFFYGSYIGWVLLDLRTMKTQMPRLTKLQKENNIQKKQILDLVGRIEEMKENIVALEKSDYEMEKMVNLVAINNHTYFMGVGGSDPHITSSDYSDADTHLEPIPFIPYSSFSIDHKINSRESEGPEEAKSSGKKECQEEEDNAKNGDREKIQQHLKEIAIELGIDPRLALSIAKVESGYDPNLVSPKGAIGVLQVMPQFVSPDYRITEEMLFDPHINIRVGLSRMKSLLNRFDNDLDLSLAAYNAGASRVVKAGYRIPSIKETEAFVSKVKEIMENEFIKLHQTGFLKKRFEHFHTTRIYF